MARKPLTKKIRFEVFKRDSFTCQYCGRMSPDVVLEADHINPVANGGDNELINLITSCHDCNSGKGKRKLSDKDEIKKQQELLKQLSEKREQLEMMLKWRDGLANLDNYQVDEIEKRFKSSTGSTFTTHGKEIIKRCIKKYGLIEIIECLEISAAQYGSDENKIFNYIPKIAAIREKQKDNPFFYKSYYIRAILKNRGMLYNEGRLRKLLNDRCTDEVGFFEIKDIAASCESWSDFWDIVNNLYGGDY